MEKKINLSIYVTLDTKNKMERIAKEKEWSLSAMFNKAAKELIARDKNEENKK